MVVYHALKSSSQEKSLLSPPDLVGHRMPFLEELETQILGSVFRSSILLLDLLLSDVPQWLADLVMFHLFDRFKIG